MSNQNVLAARIGLKNDIDQMPENKGFIRIASKKNFMQKGSRGDIKESNPHSKVVSFS